MRIMQLSPVVLLLSLAGVSHAADQLDLKDEMTRINYSLGYQIGGDFKRQGVTMDAQAVVKGIEDALNGAQPQLSPPEMLAVLRDLKSRIVTQQRTIQHEMEVKNLENDKKFLEQNKAKPGIVTTASGLQYHVIAAGKGRKPAATDTVTVNYRGTLVNDQEFDSSYERGAPGQFSLNSVIKGWTEGLQLIQEGGKIQLFIPPELAYNDRGPLAHRALVFEIELLTVEVDSSIEKQGKKADGLAKADTTDKN